MKILLLLVIGIFAISNSNALELNGYYNSADGSLKLVWNGDGGFSSEEYIIFENQQKIGLVKPDFGFDLEFVVDNPKSEASYEISKIDPVSKKELIRSKPFVATNSADLALDIAKDFECSRQFLIVNQKEKYAIKVYNNGSKLAENILFEVKNQNGKLIYSKIIDKIAPHDFALLSWEYTEDKIGMAHWTLTINSDKKVAENNYKNNIGKVSLRADAKPFYVMWYGEVPNLELVNLRQGNVAQINDFRKKGAYAGIAVACTGTPENLLATYRQILKQGFDAMYIDEIMGDHPTTDLLLEVLPTIRAEFPDVFIVVWNIQKVVSPRVAKLVKEGVINLVALEIYIKPGEDIKRIDEAAAEMRKLGIADKALIGLVSDKTWSGGASDQKYIVSLVKQIEYTQKVYPESPGIAFWSADTPAGMGEAAESKIKELYFQ